MNEKQIIDEDLEWINKVLAEDKKVNLNKIDADIQMRKMWKRTGNTPQVSFIK